MENKRNLTRLLNCDCNFDSCKAILAVTAYEHSNKVVMAVMRQGDASSVITLSIETSKLHEIIRQLTEE